MPYRPPRFSQAEAPVFRGKPDFAGRADVSGQPKSQQKRVVRQMRRGSIRYLDMRLAYFFSGLLHFLFPIGLVVASLIFYLLFGMDLFDFFNPPKPKPQDIEFVLTPPQQKSQKPIDPKTHFRAAQDMRAGGKHDPTKDVNLEKPMPQAVASLPQMPAPPVTQPVIRKWKVIPAQQPETAEKSSPAPAPKRMNPAITVPDHISKPVQSSMKTASQTPPIPAMSASSDAQVSSSSIASIASISNGAPGNNSGPLGVDALREPDFGEYMKDLQRRIKESWRPPRGNESKRVVVVFQVNRDGKLMDVRITHSSGEPLADQAAIVAVQRVFPFKPLPQEYAEPDIDIEFTFDYNVFGDKPKKNRNSFYDNG